MLPRETVDDLLLFEQFNEEAQRLLHEVFEATHDRFQNTRCLVNEPLLEDLLQNEIAHSLYAQRVQRVRESNRDDLNREMV